jgi:phosphoribosylformylglycinamidine synthase
MKIGILIFPGGHGELDLAYVLEQHFNAAILPVWHKDPFPASMDLLIIPGGFPCSGGVNGFDCLKEGKMVDRLVAFSQTGNLVIGFGNGFKLLCEAGLLPGRLEENPGGKFICKQVFIKPDNVHITLTSGLKSERAYRIPLATYRGRFRADEEEQMLIRQEDQILFRYCDHAGRISEAVNYTGSEDNIAGICNRNKNVIGMIPLPERAVIGEGEADGRHILASLLSVID